MQFPDEQFLIAMKIRAGRQQDRSTHNHICKHWGSYARKTMLAIKKHSKQDLIHLLGCTKGNWAKAKHDAIKHQVSFMLTEAGIPNRQEWREALPEAFRVNRSNGQRALIASRIIPDISETNGSFTHYDVKTSNNQ